MSEYRVVIKGGDLEAAKRVLEGVGAYNGWMTITEFVDSPDDHGSPLLHIHMDADDESEIERLFIVAPTPEESEIVQVSTADGADGD
jgi:hypothetical protein